MRIPLRYLHLHNSLHLARTNLGMKLDTAVRPLTLIYDREHQEVHVLLMGELAIIPFPAIADMHPLNPSELGYDTAPPKEAIKANPTPRKPVKAQVSTPTDHVFADKSGHVRD